MAKILINGFDGKLYVDDVARLDLLNFNDEKSLLYRGVLDSGVDLDDIVTTGIYHQTTNEGAESGVHYPADYAGVLTVVNEASLTYQKYHVNGVAEAIFFRSTDGSGWNAWSRILKDGDVNQIDDTTVSTTKAYSSSKTGTVIDTKVATAITANVDTTIVPYDTIFNTIGNLDFSTVVASTAVAKVKGLVAVENTSATNYKFMALYYNGTNSYAIPVQCVNGVVTYGTAVQLLASAEADFRNALVMDGNRILISLTTSFIVVDYATFLSPTIGTAVAITTTAGTLGLSMIKIGGTRASYVYTSSTPQAYAGCLDIGASGTTITKGTEVSLSSAYNTADVYLFKNATDANKCDLFLRFSTTVLYAYQISVGASGTTTTASSSLSMTIGTLALNPHKFIATDVGKYLIASVTSTTVMTSFTVSFNQSATATLPTAITGTATVSYSATTTDVMVVKTKVSNKYLLIYGNSASDYSASGMVYCLYDSSTGALSAQASTTGLYGFTGKSSTYGFSSTYNIHYYDMALSTADFIVLENTSYMSAIRVDISNSTALITSSTLFKSGSAYVRAFMAGQYRYVQVGKSASYGATPIRELTTGKEFYASSTLAQVSDYKGFIYDNDSNTANLLVYGSSYKPTVVQRFQVYPIYLSPVLLFGIVNDYIVSSNSGPFLKLIKKK